MDEKLIDEDEVNTMRCEYGPIDKIRFIVSSSDKDKKELSNEWILVKDMVPKEFNGNFCPYDAVLVYSDTIGKFGIATYCPRISQWNIVGGLGAAGCNVFESLKSEDITHWRIIDFPQEK